MDEEVCMRDSGKILDLGFALNVDTRGRGHDGSGLRNKSKSMSRFWQQTIC